MFNNKSAVYHKRLRILGLTTFETRRLRGDIIEIFNF